MPIPDGKDVLLADGNCIPLALWRSNDSLSRIILAALKQNSGVNTAAIARKGRTYRECFLEYQISATPHVGFAPVRDGSYLLHTEGKGLPHCFLVCCNFAEDLANYGLRGNSIVGDPALPTIQPQPNP